MFPAFSFGAIGSVSHIYSLRWTGPPGCLKWICWSLQQLWMWSVIQEHLFYSFLILALHSPIYVMLLGPSKSNHGITWRSVPMGAVGHHGKTHNPYLESIQSLWAFGDFIPCAFSFLQNSSGWHSCIFTGSNFQKGCGKQTNTTPAVIVSRSNALMHHWFKIIPGLDS